MRSTSWTYTAISWKPSVPATDAARHSPDKRRAASREREGAMPTGRKAVSRHLKIVVPPAHGAAVSAQPRFEWYAVKPLPPGTTYEVIVAPQGGGQEKRFRGIEGTAFRVPEPLPPGKYTVQVVASAPRRLRTLGRTRKFRSPRSLVKVREKADDDRRIHCGAAWTNLFVGHHYANPCCRLRRRAGSPYIAALAGQIDFWNTEGLMRLRESLLRGDASFCLPDCPNLRKRGGDPAERFDAHVKASPGGKGLLRALESDQSHPLVEHYRRLRMAYCRGEASVPGPLHLKVSLGSACQCDCIFCKKVPRPWKQAPQTFELVQRLQDRLLRLSLTGGEPLIHMNARLRRLLRFDGNPFCTLSLFTNGLELADCADLLAGPGQLNLRCSISAGTAETYRHVQGSPDFERIWHGLAAVKQARDELGKATEITLTFNYMQCNVHEIPDFAERAARLEPDRIRFNEVILYKDARVGSEEKIRPGSADWRELEGLLEQARRVAEAANMDFVHVESKGKDDLPDD